jgi:aspartyl-tRNA(Asn)/glutamyl-tRNA(Gln) amidotransferase subunit A
MEQARHAEQEFTHGRVVGPMQGIPYVTKDNVDVAGLPTTCHSKVMAGHVAEADAFVIQRLRAAGAILIGKVALHEFAKGGAMSGLPWPPARNPWDPSRHPGGSSSGSGAAVAAGMVPAAIGTDTGGSVRHPATACGVVGLKPTYGAISRRGVMPLAFSLDTVGPLTRSVEDNAIFFESLRGHDALDPTSATATPQSCVNDLRRGIRGMRIGLIEHFYREDMQADADYCAAIDVAVEVFESLGAQVTRARVSPLPIWAACGGTILDAEAFAIHENWLKERPQDYSKNSRSKILVGGFISASKYLQAQQMRTLLRTEFETAMRDFDVVITMSSMEPPCELDNEAEIARSYGRHARMPFNVTGSPAISVPIGFGSKGLPIGLQIAGKPFDEATVYQAAWAYCNATSWTGLRPPAPSATAPSKDANVG